MDFIVDSLYDGKHLLEHLQGVGPVTVQPLALLGRLQAELVGLGLQSRHLLLEDTATGRLEKRRIPADADAQFHQKRRGM